MSAITVNSKPEQHIVVNQAGSSVSLAPQVQFITVSSGESSINVRSLTQKIVVNPGDSSVGIINAGPIGPPGIAGPPDAESVLTIDGQIMTRFDGHLFPITRADLAADPAFTAYWTAHLAALDPHPQYLTPAEGDALFLTPAEGNAAYLTPAAGDALFLTPAEGNAAYVNITGDTMTAPLVLQYNGNSLVLKDASAYISWYNGGTREGYLQGNAAGLILNSETGVLLLYGAGGINFSGGRVDFGGHPITGTNGVINGYTMSTTASGTRIVCVDSSGYIWGNYINMTADITAGWPPYIAGRNSGDNFLRWYNKSGSCIAGQFHAQNNSAGWSTVGFLCYPGAGYAAATFHCGSVAIIIASVNGTGNMLYVRDANFSPNSANVAAANFSLESSHRWKRNINPYPLLAAGAGVARASEVISRLRPVTFEPIAPDVEVFTLRRTKALEVVNRMRAAKGLPDYELPIHECSIHDCNGTVDDPCCRVINRQRMIHGLVAEEVFEVFPDAVVLDVDRLPSGIDVGQLLSISIAAIKELTERIKVLEEA